jgi:hypothetical protein
LRGIRNQLDSQCLLHTHMILQLNGEYLLKNSFYFHQFFPCLKAVGFLDWRGS